MSATKPKPIPPPDLWSRIEAHLAEVAILPRPENSFTRKEFMARFNLTEGGSYRRLQAMQRAGTVKRFGTGNSGYYMLTTDVKMEKGEEKE